MNIFSLIKPLAKITATFVLVANSAFAAGGGDAYIKDFDFSFEKDDEGFWEKYLGDKRNQLYFYNDYLVSCFFNKSFRYIYSFFCKMFCNIFICFTFIKHCK